MGFIDADKVAVQEMPIYNRGDAALVIQSIKSSCSCTRATMKDTTIPAQGQGTLVLEVDPAKFSGFHSRKQVTIRSNDPEAALVQLTVTADIKGDVVYSGTEIDFGVIAPGKPYEQSIRVSNTQAEGATLKEVTLRPDSPDFLSIDVREVPVNERKAPDTPSQMNPNIFASLRLCVKKQVSVVQKVQRG